MRMMNLQLKSLGAVLALTSVLVASASTVKAQGPLAPPGAPAPAMKTLDQVEPRGLIKELPYTITQPGSYYLAGNLTSTGHGVVVRADGVTLDLQGFRITGNGGGSFRGVLAEKPGDVIRDVVVRNGHIDNFGIGLRAMYARGARFEDLTLSGNVNHGAEFFSGQGNTIARCVMQNNAQDGLYIYGAFGFGASSHHTMTDSSFLENGRHGIHLYAQFGEASGNRIVNCIIAKNDNIGLVMNAAEGRCVGNEIVDSTVVGNQVNGIYLDGTNNGVCDGNAIRFVSVYGNAGTGIFLNGEAGSCSGNTLEGLTVRENGIINHGIMMFGNCSGNLIAHSTVQGHAFNGILIRTGGHTANGNRVVDCTLIQNEDRGLYVLADGGQTDGHIVSGNIIAGNGAKGAGVRTESEGRSHGHAITRNVFSHQPYGLSVAASGGSANGNRLEYNTVTGCSTGVVMSVLNNGAIDANRLESFVVSESAHRGVVVKEGGLDIVDGLSISRLRVFDNLVSGSGSHGMSVDGLRIVGTRVQGNSFIENGGSSVLMTFAKGGLVAHNLMYPSSDIHTFWNSNASGPVVTQPGDMALNTPGQHPWANFKPMLD